MLLALLGVLTCVPAPARAQGDPAPSASTTDDQSHDQDQATDPDLASPRDAMFTFLAAINEYQDAATTPGRTAAMNRAIKCLDIAANLPAQTKRNIARDLYTVLGRIGEVRPSQLPVSTAPTTDRFVYYPQPTAVESHRRFAARYPGFSIVLTRDSDGNWRFSQATIDRVHDFAIATESELTIAGTTLSRTPLERLRDRVPASLKGTSILALEYWQWLAIFLTIFLGVLLDWFIRALLRAAWRRFEARRARRPDTPAEEPIGKDALDRAVRPFGLIAAGALWYIALSLGLIPPAPTMILIVAVRVILVVAVVWGAYRITDRLGDWLTQQASRSETKFDDLLVPMLTRTAKIFITAIGLIYLASAFSIEILPLLTGLGIGGLAIAFAAKDTIENFFGSVAVILDRPFEIGDWVLVNDVEGTVEDLGFRSTRIRTFYNSLVTVPNSTLVRTKVDNYGRRKYRRFRTMINVTYDTHPDKIEAFCAGIREIIKLHPYTRKDYYHVWLNSFGAHSLDILVYMFFECPDWSIELREKHRFMLDIIRLADRLGVEFAFPTQTLHVAQLDPTAEHHPGKIPDAQAERRAVLEGRKLARELTSDQPWKREKPGPVLFAEEFDSEYEARGDSAG